MPPEILTCEQRSPDWYRARMGIPTASMFKAIIAKPKEEGYGGRISYMHKLAGEVLTDEPMENYTNDDMQRGVDQEEEARKAYAVQTNNICEQVGFVRNGKKGCSPDSFVGTERIVEIKVAAAHVLTPLLARAELARRRGEPAEFPATHKAQCQGNLWVCEREVIDIAIYCRKLPVLIVPARRDEAYIVNLKREIDRFNADLHELIESVKRYGGWA